MQNNYFYKWIDSNKDDEINSFKECIDSYIYFKKDAFYKTNKLIKKKPEFNAPLNAVKTISPAPKKFPYESTPGRKPSGAFEKSAPNKKSQIMGCNIPAKRVDGLLFN